MSNLRLMNRFGRSVVLASCLLFSACTSTADDSHTNTHTDSAGEEASTPPATRLAVFYTKTDGERLGVFHVALGDAHDLKSTAYLASVSALNGPPVGIHAIRFPVGTSVRSVRVEDATAIVDLSSDIAKSTPGGFAESGEFKALVWTLTALPGISHVKILVAGATVPTLPGGHFELDEPLARTDW